MQLLMFEVAVIARTVDDRLLIALLDGKPEGEEAHRCVGLFSCSPEVAEALCVSVGSALKPAVDQ